MLEQPTAAALMIPVPTAIPHLPCLPHHHRQAVIHLLHPRHLKIPVDAHPLDEHGIGLVLHHVVVVVPHQSATVEVHHHLLEDDAHL
jgi:hypothetical protein